MTHIAIQEALDGRNVIWMEPVSGRAVQRPVRRPAPRNTLTENVVMSNNIDGKVVVITGSGLGEATARHLAAEVPPVVLGARRTERMQALTEEVTAKVARPFF